jgi:hypothetical protein
VLVPSSTRRRSHARVLHCTQGLEGELPLQGRLLSAVLKGLDNLIDRGRLDEHIVEASVCRFGMRLGVVRPSRVGDKPDLLAVALAQSTRHLQTVNRRQFEVDEGDLRPGALRSDRAASPSYAINVPYPIERRTSATACARAGLSSTIKTVGTAKNL